MFIFSEKLMFVEGGKICFYATSDNVVLSADTTMTF